MEDSQTSALIRLHVYVTPKTKHHFRYVLSFRDDFSDFVKFVTAALPERYAAAALFIKY